MKHIDFHEAFEDCSRLAGKVPKSSYLNLGNFPVIGQGKQAIEGYTNDSSLLFRGELPVILFGDHTAVFKFINQPFARGADGTKLFRPKRKDLDTKYAWHFLLTAKLPDTGYDRKTKFLKNLIIPIPSNAEQKRITAILDKVQSQISKHEIAIDTLKELYHGSASSLFNTGSIDRPLEQQLDNGEGTS